MSPSRCILWLDDSHWRLSRLGAEGPEHLALTASVDADAASLAAEVAARIEHAGSARAELVLALDAPLCLSASFSLADLPPRPDRQALYYALEEYLPIAAETLTAEFWLHAGQAFGVAVETDWAAQRIHALENLGLSVASVVPAAFLALAHHQQTAAVSQDASSERQVVLWGRGDRLEWLSVAAGCPQSWNLLPADPRQLTLRLAAESLARPSTTAVFAYDLPPALLEVLHSAESITLTLAETSFGDAVVYAGEAVLLGQVKPLIELRRDQLAGGDPFRAVRGPLRFALFAAAFLLLSAVAAFQVRAYQYEIEADAWARRQEALFSQTFPGRPIPLGVKSRFESELHRLEGLSGAADRLPPSTSALTLLHQTLAALPDGAKYRIWELRVDRALIHLDGEVPSHADADVLAGALRQAGFTVPAPRTQNLPDQRVSYRLTVEPPSTPAQPSERRAPR